MNYEEQILELNKLVDKKYIKTDEHVKGPYTSGDYVRYQLNQIFGNDKWSSTITKGPDMVTLNNNNAYVEVVIRLEVEFANGNKVTHDDVGVWPLAATKNKDGNSVGLTGTAPERYETVLKAVVTDGLKACTEYLGLCFRPLGDKDLEATIRNANKAPVTRPTVTVPSAPISTPPTQPLAPVTTPKATQEQGNGNGNGADHSEQLPITGASILTTGGPASGNGANGNGKSIPVNSTTYYIAATGTKYQFTQPVAREIANTILGGVGKNTDFAPAMAALPYFFQCSENGMEMAKAIEILRECGMDLEKASSKVYGAYA
jgi:hypothetical protein